MAVTTYTLTNGTAVSITALSPRANRIDIRPATPVEGVYDADTAITIVQSSLKEVLGILGLSDTFSWRTAAKGDQSCLAARADGIEQQHKVAAQAINTTISFQAFTFSKDATVFSPGFRVTAEQTAATKQLDLDAADLFWCIIMDEIEAVHYELTSTYGETLAFGDAIIHNNGKDGAAVTVWEYAAQLEAIYKKLQDDKLIGALDRSRIPGSQRQAMITTFDDKIIDSQLGKVYQM